MKRINDFFCNRLVGIVALLLTLLIVPVHSQEYTQQDLDAALKNGEKAYQQRDYQRAEKEYSKALWISQAINGEEPKYISLGWS